MRGLLFTATETNRLSIFPRCRKSSNMFSAPAASSQQSMSAVAPFKDMAIPKYSLDLLLKSSVAGLQISKPSFFARFNRKSEKSQTMTFFIPKYLNATAAAMPMVPLPKTTAFCPETYFPSPQGIIPLRAARQPTVKGSIRLASLSEIRSSTV